MVYILGTAHDIQYGDHPKKSRRLYKMLGQMIEDLGITVLAEEVNDSNFQNPEHWMLVKEQAQKHGIEHIQCEPDMTERASYGLEDISIIAECGDILNSDELTPEEKKPYWEIMNHHSEKRERIWFERIKNKKDSKILLVVGASHVSTNLRSRGRGVDTILAENDWPYMILPFTD